MAENKLEFIDLVDELAKVRLEPLVIPALKIIDPILVALPEGVAKGYLDKLKPQAGQFAWLEGLAPKLPGMIRTIGKVAEIKAVTTGLSILAEILVPIEKVIIRGVQFAMPVLKPLCGMACEGIKTLKAKVA